MNIPPSAVSSGNEADIDEVEVDEVLAANKQTIKERAFRGQELRISLQGGDEFDLVNKVAWFLNVVTAYKPTVPFSKYIQWTIVGMELEKDLNAVEDGRNPPLAEALKGALKAARIHLKEKPSTGSVVDEAWKFGQAFEEIKIIQDKLFAGQKLMCGKRDLINDLTKVLAEYVNPYNQWHLTNWKAHIRAIEDKRQTIVPESSIQEFLLKMLGEALNDLNSDVVSRALRSCME